jgi:hypothetical protein
MYEWKYVFNLEDGSRKEFNVRLDPETLLVEQDYKGTLPDWTKLDFHRCPNCPFAGTGAQYCPIAKNIAGFVTEFNTAISSANGQVVVMSEERSVTRHTSLAEGLYSLLGIYMAASGCPHMEKLKPMAAYHLPFSSIEETVYRAMTMYTAGQYFRMREGLTPDWEMKGLVKMYDEIRLVNQGFADRLRGAAEKDSVINSLVNLDVFAMVLLDLPSNVDGLERIFSPYLEK